MNLFSNTSIASNTTCTYCGRPLSDPDSIARGCGPVCASRNGLGGDGASGMADPFADRPLDELGEIVSITVALICRRVNGIVYTNVPHLVTQHSPSGFEFGYGGSGPADLALNVAAWFVGEMGLETDRKVTLFDGGKVSWVAWALHQGVKAHFIAPMDKGGARIEADQIRTYVRREAEMLLAQEEAIL